MTTPTPVPPPDVAVGIRIAKAIARRLAGRWAPVDELVSEALVALAVALDRFDPDRGIPFEGFAAMCVRRRLTAVVGQWKRRHHLAAVGRGRHAWEGDRDGNGDKPGDSLAALADPRAADPGDLAAGRELWERIRPHLTAAQFDVLHARAHGRTLLEIGRDRNGVTRQRVAQIERRAVQRARKAVGAVP